MKRIKYIVCLLLFVCSPMYAQKEGNNWAFGTGAGLTWNTTTNKSATRLYPSGGGTKILEAIPNSISTSISTTEGCFAYSNTNGVLLFYSDGSTVHRGNGTTLSGVGLSGGSSSVQSGIVFPKPGSTNQYIAVSIPEYLAANSSSDDVRYAVIQATTNSDASVVQTGTKITGGSGAHKTESVQAIRHANGTDFWLIVPGCGSATSQTYLNLWLITSNGSQVQVQFKGATALPINVAGSSKGYLKFSPDGKYFAWGTWTRGVLYFGKFNDQTGVFSDMNYIGTNAGYYGVEFSPNGKYLYVTYAETSGTVLKRYDFAALIQNPSTSATTLVSSTAESGITAQTGALQLAHDGRIYFIRNGQKTLYIIDNPDDATPDVYKISSHFGGTPRLGLPTFSSSFFQQGAITLTTPNTTPCIGDNVTFTTTIAAQGTGPYQITHIRWYVDGTQVAHQELSGTTNTYTITGITSGAKTIKAVACNNTTEINGGQTITVTPKVCDTPASVSAITGDASLCTGVAGSYSITVTQGTGTASTSSITRLVWNFGDGSATEETTSITGNGSHSKSHAYATTGTKTITVTPYNGSTALTTLQKTFTVTVQSCSGALSFTGIPTSLCKGEAFEYIVTISDKGSGSNEITNIRWNFGDGTTLVSTPVSGSAPIVVKTMHTYTAGGKDYTITATPYSGSTALSSISVTVRVNTCSISVNPHVRAHM